MKYRDLLIISLLLLGFNGFGQKIKEVKVKFPKSKQIKEVFEVLKKDKSIKHGKYIAYHKQTGHILTDYIRQEGSYLNGEKEGLWITYKAPYRKGNSTSCCSLYSKGNYKNGKKVGIWESYFEKGLIIKKYDFDNDVKLETEFARALAYAYPVKAQLKNIEGVVKISYELDDSCKLLNITVIEGLGYGCDKQCIKILKDEYRLRHKYKIRLGECESKKYTKEFTYKLK